MDQQPLPEALSRELEAAAKLRNDPPRFAAELSRLLQAHPQHRRAIEAWAATPTERAPAAATGSHRHIGPYRILDVLGEGGMGTVYVAEQHVPVRRRVALKVIKLGMDSKAIVARFEQERQALALMDHEGIAKVFDCGTSDGGQPYFAMELVKGIPLDQFCEQQKLALEDRIVLLQQVCSAVQHAHQKGVVHRDLKPGNVLVGDDGGRRQIKIIDFGLAKAMGPKLVEATLFTEAGQIVGTPEFMAPEQADPTNLDIDTRADIYSLGVMLYQVLCGELPFSGAELRRGGILGVQRILREIEPPRPSTKITALGDSAHAVAQARRVSLSALKRALQGDLDWIVLKALEKERNRRYETPTALAADLQRFLDHEPLVAGPPSATYRLKKLLRRHRGEVAATAAVLITATIGAAVAIDYALAASSNAQIAASRAEEISRLADERGRRIEDFNQLAAVVRLRTAHARQEAVWPAWPERIADLEAWLQRDCAQLLAMRPQIEQTIATLRARSLPTSPEQIEADRRAAPEFSSWQRQSLVTAELRRAQAIRSGAQKLELPSLPATLAADDVEALNGFAWVRVAPEKNGDPPDRTIFGETAVALVAARAAVASPKAQPPQCGSLDTLAWAALANGQDDEARQCTAKALAAAKPEQRAEYEGYQRAILAAIDEAPARLQAAEKRLAELDARVAERRSWSFADDADGASARFLHETLTESLAELTRLAEVDRPDVEKRLRWAREVAAASKEHPKARVSWMEARAAIARADGVTASRLYADKAIELRDEDVVGLVPIGMNPVTHLWEFYDLRSAWDGESDLRAIEIPSHRADGSIEVTGATGIVFVLMPGGDLTLGAQSQSPDAPLYDARAEPDEKPHPVSLAPFFLARHELTRGQWRRLAGEQPTQWPDGARYQPEQLPIGPTHPADMMDWYTADRWLTRHGMCLPTEAQWEYGCRGGTTTAWWSGAEPTSLQGCANLHDRTSAALYPQLGASAPIDDGFAVLAPVGRFRANPFGLFDTHGNVWEWCRDVYGDYGSERAGDGLRTEATSDRGVQRGGGVVSNDRKARCAERSDFSRTVRDANLGVRAARAARR